VSWRERRFRQVLVPWWASRGRLASPSLRLDLARRDVGGADTGICKQGELVLDKNKDGQVLLSHIVCWAGAVQDIEHATAAQNWPRMHQSESSGVRGSSQIGRATYQARAEFNIEFNTESV
jgi:hypothetical protein